MFFRQQIFSGLALIAMAFSPVWVSGQVLQTDFTYQGQLRQGGSPANGTFNFTFLMWSAPTGGSQIGATVDRPNVPVTNGLFTVELDFGASALNGADRWLEVRVAGTFLAPRQPINGTPYALQTRGIFVNQTETFVGVGRDTPITGAEVFGINSPATSAFGGMYINTAGVNGMPFYGYSTAGMAGAFHFYDGSNGNWQLSNGGATRITATETGEVGIGTASPLFRFHVVGGTDAETTGGGYLVAGPQTGANLAIDNNEIIARNNNATATLFLNNDGGNVSIGQNSAGTSRLLTPVLEITGGSDLSEMFDVRGDVAIEPGMVVSIDPENPGRLVLSNTNLDRRVAGIISGAGGIATGLTMGQDGTIANGKYPVALTGRVYCLVDARGTAITPGDMLTTSTNPGHAVKVSDNTDTSGAIIGKAMSSLQRGEVGLVLVLVNLQ